MTKLAIEMAGLSFKEHIDLLAGVIQANKEGIDALLQLDVANLGSFSQFVIENQLSCYLFDILSDSQATAHLPPRFVDTIAARCRGQAKTTLVFEVFAYQAQFQNVAQAMDGHADSLCALSRDEAYKLLQPARLGGIANKLWAANLYETSTLGYVTWWAVSLPFRLFVYKPES